MPTPHPADTCKVLQGSTIDTIKQASRKRKNCIDIHPTAQYVVSNLCPLAKYCVAILWRGFVLHSCIQKQFRIAE